MLVRVCPRNVRGEYVAPKLAEEQTLDNLFAFGDDLRVAYADMKGS